MSAINIIETLRAVLLEHRYDAIEIALPEFKKNNLNVIELQKHLSLPVQYIPKERLLTLQPRCTSFSQISYDIIGLGAVAEACALALMGENGHLLIPKILYNNISFAIATKGE